MKIKNYKELKAKLNSFSDEKLYNMILETLHKTDKKSVWVFELSLTEYKTRVSYLDYKVFYKELNRQIRARMNYKEPKKILGGVV